MTGGTCPGCQGTGRDWVCLGTGYACPETKTGVCQRCHGTRRCDLCDAPFLLTDPTADAAEALGRTSGRVLVIDDEPSMLHLLGLWFGEDARCSSIHVVDSPDAALVSIAEQTPDAIVCDFHLGPVTSDRYLPGIRSAATNARIVIYTCDPPLAQAAGVLDHGADVVLDKLRVPLEQLVDVVMRAPVAVG